MSGHGKVISVRGYLIKGGEKGGTHETKKDDSKAIFWDKMLFIRLPGRTWLSL